MSVQLHPSNQLGFNRPLTQVVRRTLTFTNHNSQPVAFKVKTTAPELYHVRPDSGAIEPGDSIDVQALLQAMDEDLPLSHKCKDKFFVQSMIIPPDRLSKSTHDMWVFDEDEEVPQIHQQKIKVAYLPPEGQVLEEDTSGRAQESTMAGGAAPLSDVVSLLVEHGCQDITEKLDPSAHGEYPVSSGGFGDVYKGRLRDGSPIAIKCMKIIINPYSAEHQNHLKCAAREIHTWSKLRHHYVSGLLGLSVFRGQIAMVSPWAEHGSLPGYLTKKPELNKPLLCAQIAEGLAFLHGSGVIHGDLKGANVLVSDAGEPLLADFGNAVLYGQTLQFTYTTAKSNLSPRWTAPELLDEGSCSFEADVYALGMFSFSRFLIMQTILRDSLARQEVITGKVPYPSLKEIQVINAVSKRRYPTRPEEHIPTTIQGNLLWATLCECWAFESKSRPTAAQVQDAVRVSLHETSFHVMSAPLKKTPLARMRAPPPPVLLSLAPSSQTRDYDDPQRPRAHSALPPPSRRQSYDPRPDPRATQPRRQSTSAVPGGQGWALPPLTAPGQQPYYTRDAFGAHAYIEPRGQYCPQQYQYSPQGYPSGPPYAPGPSGATVDPNIFKPDPYTRHPGMPASPGPDRTRPDVQITYTDNWATKLTQYLRRRCFNCRVTEVRAFVCRATRSDLPQPPGWRKSTLNPGKIVCNKCGLYERSHARPRPLHMDYPKGPAQ
ncbi:phosphatidylinositol-binding protein scs2 [Ceratobasidium sp. 414]|nr:phosphatidylinositol-binding protein scs2 [Ceratobasidium sp. 414]